MLDAPGSDSSRDAFATSTFSSLSPQYFWIRNPLTRFGDLGKGLPATAQVASQKATYLAKQLNKGNVTEKEFLFRNWGTMTYLGNWTAIHQSSADELKGWAAWVLWRTAYLTRSMSIRNKISKQFPRSCTPIPILKDP